MLCWRLTIVQHPNGLVDRLLGMELHHPVEWKRPYNHIQVWNRTQRHSYVTRPYSQFFLNITCWKMCSIKKLGIGLGMRSRKESLWYSHYLLTIIIDFTHTFKKIEKALTYWSTLFHAYSLMFSLKGYRA